MRLLARSRSVLFPIVGGRAANTTITKFIWNYISSRPVFYWQACGNCSPQNDTGPELFGNSAGYSRRSVVWFRCRKRWKEANEKWLKYK